MSDTARSALAGALLDVARAGRHVCFSAYHAAAGLNYAHELYPPKKRVPGGSFRSFEFLNIHGRDALLRRLLFDCAPGETVHDIGAHTGVYALACAAVHSCHVVAFEPNPMARERFRANVRANEFGERVTVRECGLADRSGTLPFYRATYPELASFSRYNATRWGSEVRETLVVRVRTLDELVAAGTPPPDRLKIDVEGFSPEVLAGATEVLATYRPTIYLESHPTEAGNREPDLRALFDEYDYRIEPCADAWVCTPASR